MTTATRPLAVRAYRRLVRLVQPWLYREHGEEMVDTFHDQYMEARASGGARRAVRLFARSATLLLTSAMRRDPTPREARGWRPDHIGQDIRYCLRALRRQPGFTLAAILILGVGIGATTTIYSVVDTVVLRQMPYPGAGRLLHFRNGSHSFPSFRAWRALTSFESVVAVRQRETDLTGDRLPERLPSVAVSEDFFRVFGAAPHLGRLFNAADFPGDGTIAVLGFGAWMQTWGGDASILGSTITLDGRPHVVVGVMSPRFVAPAVMTGSRVDVWLPLDDGGERAHSHGSQVLGIAGRLAPGIDVDTAQAEVDAQRAAAAAEFPRYYELRAGGIRPVPLVPLREATVGRVGRTLYLLLGAVGLMLLIACANVAGLSLARGTARAREIALRLALGAGRRRLAGLVLTESLLLSVGGGVLGLALALGGVEAFKAFNPGGVPRVEHLQVDVRILAASLVLTVATGLLFGWLPAWQTSRSTAAGMLKGGPNATTGRGGRRTRDLLVAVELALALVLCTSAGLLLRSLSTLTHVDLGFRTESLSVLQLSLDNHPEEVRPRFVVSLLDAIRSRPGTSAVAAGWTAPFRYTGGSRCCWGAPLQGDPALAPDTGGHAAIVHAVTDEYFATLEAPLASGRGFTPADARADDPGIILNRAAARLLFGREDVIGREVTLADRRHRLIGIVEGIRHWGQNQEIEPTAYVTFAQYGGQESDINVIVRTSLPPAAVSGPLREVVRQLDPRLPVGDLVAMDDWVSRSVATPRFLALLFGSFAAVALLIAAGGLYGSMLYTVGQRRREMGIRLALGAGSPTVMRLILGQGVRVTAIGVAGGLAAALAVMPLMTSLIWGVEPTDPVTLVGVAAVLAAAALVACALPAWRASRTNPLDTLRAD